MDAHGVASSSSSSIPEKYDVFLSFRGEDTREKFISHLYVALDRKKIKTYKDDTSLERGDEISPALVEAIKKSKMSIIVFSKDYASSPWCLGELVHIIECHRQNKQMVVPVFYEVDPSHVRKQEGSYGEAFLKHQERFKDNMETVQKWRVALTESANLSGWDSQVTRPESKLVKVIVEDVLRKLSRGQPSNLGFEGLIGIDETIEEIKSLLSVHSPKVRIIGIWGMGGIGKTTLAQVMYHQLYSQFEASCFVPNIRETAEKGSLIKLRNELLAELLKGENLNVGTLSLLPFFVKERIQRTKVLIVLDDVNHVKQLKTLVDDFVQFSCDSRIVITTRDASLLRDISAEIYEVKLLGFNEALQLFNLIAFRGKSPATDYIELSENVVKHVQGVPLAIKVLGSHFRSLRSQRKEAWEAALDKLKVVPPDDIYNVLRISFDGLDNMEKDIFLDIACFFKRWSRASVENILNACGFFANTGIDALIDKSLITIEGNVLWMHDLLVEMGQKIVCEESKELGERSRLWNAEEVIQVLENNAGTAKIQGIFLGLFNIEEEIQLEPTIFKRMHNLRLLKIYDSFDSKKCKVYLQNGLCYLPSSLRYLEWYKYPLKSLPRNFKSRNLVELLMPHSQLEEVWDGFQDLKKLRCIDLRHSIHVKRIPDLSLVQNLERINLAYCTSLHQVHLRTDVDLRTEVASLGALTLQGCSNITTLPMTRSLTSLDLSASALECLPSAIGSLKNLSQLYLNDCKRLTNLPSSMIELDSLKYLELKGCSILEKFPELPWNIIELDISETAIKEVDSSSIEGRLELSELYLSDCKSLESLPTNIYRLRSFASLRLGGCKKLKKLPEILGPMEMDGLGILDLRGTGIRQLPSSIGNLIAIHELFMDECEALDYFPRSLSFLPSVLECVSLSDSTIKEIPESIIKGIFKLEMLSIRNCKNLCSLPELPLSLRFLDASGCASLEEVLNSRRALTREFWIADRISLYCFEILLFCDCVKLDKKERDNIIIDFQLRVLRLATQYVPPEDEVTFGPVVSVCCPGNEIPEWFEYQNDGSTINIKLQQEWNNRNFLGFVVCAVGDSYSDVTCLEFICHINLKPHQWGIHSYRWNSAGFWSFEHEGLPSTTSSSHLYMWYKPENYRNCLDAEEASFHFDVDFVGSSQFQVKKCGIHMLYHQDLEKLGLNFINDKHLRLEELDSDAAPDKPEPSGASSINGSDTEEPLPKRTKF